MRRAGRILHRLLNGLSLLLLLATVVVWVRSYWVSDTLGWYDWPQDRSFFDIRGILSSRGAVQFMATRYLSANIQTPGVVHFQYERKPANKYPILGDNWSWNFSPEPHRYAALGFEWIPTTTTRWAFPVHDRRTISSLTVPLYFPCLLFAILPAHDFVRLRRRRRIARRLALGCCIACGYDLRASSGRCPECGLPVGRV